MMLHTTARARSRSNRHIIFPRPFTLPPQEVTTVITLDVSTVAESWAGQGRAGRAGQAGQDLHRSEAKV
jgi:hypothetical protein